MENKLKQEPKTKSKNRNLKSKGVTLRKLLTLDNYLDRTAINKQLPFLLYLFFLGVLYIWNGHYQSRTIRAIEQVNNRVKELNWEYMTTQSDIMNMSKQSELAKMVDSIGLQELKTPPTILYISK